MPSRRTSRSAPGEGLDDRLPSIGIRKSQRETIDAAAHALNVPIATAIRMALAAIKFMELDEAELCRCPAGATNTGHPGICIYCSRFCESPKGPPPKKPRTP